MESLEEPTEELFRKPAPSLFGEDATKEHLAAKETDEEREASEADVAAESESDGFEADNGLAIEKSVDTFTDLGGIPGDNSDGRPILPKARERFPFGAKERPVRTKFSLTAHLKSLFDGKSAVANVAPVLVLGFLIYCMVHVVAEKPYLMLLNGEPIAFVQGEESGQRLLAQATLEMSTPYPAESNFRHRAVVSYTQNEVKIKTKTSEDQIVLDALKRGITWMIDAWVIVVGNESTVFLASRSQAEEVLENVKRSYLPNSDQYTILNTEFVEPVSLVSEEIPVTRLGTQEQAFRTLTQGREPLREHRVQSGESYWSIANKNNMTADELKRINGANNDMLRIGQVLRLNNPKPLLSVKLKVSAVLQEDIPYDTIYRDNSEAWQGQNRVLHAGAPGTMKVEYEIDIINGFAIEQKVLSQTVIARPVSRVVENGTRVIVASRADTINTDSGALSWPIRSKVTSSFGRRGNGFHSGVDIQAKTGDPVYSAAAGTVTAARNNAGYGLMVSVDHGDGLSTVYAHLSQISVSSGQQIGRQELVGLAGSTGRTSGPHLHFEVRLGGSPENPVAYLE